MLKKNRDKTALLVIDMQNAYLHPEGSFTKLGLDVTPLREAIPGCRELIDAAHAAEVTIIFLKYVLRPDYKDGGLLVQEIWPTLADVNYVAAGSWDAEIVEELKPEPQDIIIEKSRYSAFYGTSLESLLTSLKIDTLVVCGVTTHFCVESTARDAGVRDYWTYVVRDATAEVNPEWHEMALASFGLGWGWVVPRSEVISAWKA